jgi:hypothetical protein
MCHETLETPHIRDDCFSERARSPFSVEKSTKLISFFIINGTINTNRGGSFENVCDRQGKFRIFTGVNKKSFDFMIAMIFGLG